MKEEIKDENKIKNYFKKLVDAQIDADLFNHFFTFFCKSRGIKNTKEAVISNAIHDDTIHTIDQNVSIFINSDTVNTITTNTAEVSTNRRVEKSR